MALTYTLTVARSRLGELVHRAVFGRETVIITEHGREVAAIISVEELASLQAAADAEDLRMTQRVAEVGGPGVPHADVMALLDALDTADQAESPEAARRLLEPHADLLASALEANDRLSDQS